VKWANADEWLSKMLTSGANPKCPDHLKGVWWMSDNQCNQETIMTFQHADWSDEKNAILRYDLNWARTGTCGGMILNLSVGIRQPTFTVEISPTGEWMRLDGYAIFVNASEHEFRTPDGERIELEPGDMMRIDHEDREDPSTSVTYQYIVRKIAFLNDTGELVKTPNFDRLQKCLNFAESRLNSSKCNYCICGADKEIANLLYTAVNPTNFIRFPETSP